MTTVSTSQKPASRNLARTYLTQEMVLLIITVITIAFITTRTDRFLTADNLLNQAALLMEVAIMALPMTFIIITGGIDLSVGSTFALSAIVMGFAWQDAGLPLEVAIVLCLITGMICGAINGWFIVRVGVPPLIMTLATLALYRGVGLGISEARAARGFPEWFTQFGRGEVFGLPTQLVIFIVFAIVCALILWKTPFGRWLYAVGNNETGARFAGIPVNMVKVAIYTFSGFMAALAGFIFTSRVTTTRADMGTGIELDVIAAVVLGGTSIFGGTGSILGTVLGLILIQTLKNGLSLAGVRGDATIVMIGVILILAILVNTYIQRRLRS